MHHRTEQEIMENWKGDKGKPLVNICTITYNHEDYIGEALDGFLMQETDFPFNVLIAEDCSTDNTANVIREYEKKYPNIIKPIYQKENQYSKGVDVTVVFNFSRAKGAYIAFCEGDDYWTDKNKLQIQIEAMRENTECNMSFHPVKELLGHKIEKTIAAHSSQNKVFTASEIILGGGEFCPTASLIFKREVMLNLPGWLLTEVTAGDHYIQILGSLKGGALYVHRNMSVYRTGHPGAWTTIMKEIDGISIASHIKNQEAHTSMHVKALNSLKNDIDKQHCKAIDEKISERLFTLSILYLKNGRYEEFQKTVVKSHDAYRSSFILHNLVYYFRFAPYVLKILIKLRKIV